MIIDLHCHTHHSHDAFTTPLELLRSCLARGINAVAITDHDCIAHSTIRFLNSHGIEVIPGCEFTDHTGAHIIGLFVKRTLPIGSNTELVLSHIHTEGGFCLMPHPWKPGSGYMVMNGNLDLVSRFHFVELINGGWPSQSYATEIVKLATSYNLRMIATSDSHKACQVGLCCTRFLNSSCFSSVYNLLKFSKQKDMDLLIDSSMLRRVGRRTNPIQRSSIYQSILPFIPCSIRRIAKILHYRLTASRSIQPVQFSSVDTSASPW